MICGTTTIWSTPPNPNTKNVPAQTKPRPKNTNAKSTRQEEHNEHHAKQTASNMIQLPIFITLTGRQTGAKVRLNINNITKYRQDDNGGTLLFTNKSDTQAYMCAREKPDNVDVLITDAVKQIIESAKPQPYSLKP